MSNWKTVFTTSLNHEAEILKSILVSKGIQAVIMNKQDTSYKLGVVEVMVPQESVLASMQVVQEFGKAKDE